MSNANKPEKVLRVALKRLQKGWVKVGWSSRNKKTGVTAVCIEGAIYGFTNGNAKNPVCLMARDIVLQVIQDKYPENFFTSIPQFNDDPATTYPMVEEVVKLALIRAETGGLLRDTEEEC